MPSHNRADATRASSNDQRGVDADECLRIVVRVMPGGADLKSGPKEVVRGRKNMGACDGHHRTALVREM
eukprot:3997581-Pyramimonas_sp.AAC.1